MPVGMQPVNQVSAALVPGYALTSRFRHTSMRFDTSSTVHFRSSLYYSTDLFYEAFSLTVHYRHFTTEAAWGALIAPPAQRYRWFKFNFTSTLHHLWKNMQLITQLLHGTNCDATKMLWKMKLVPKGCLWHINKKSSYIKVKALSS